MKAKAKIKETRAKRSSLYVKWGKRSRIFLFSNSIKKVKYEQKPQRNSKGTQAYFAQPEQKANPKELQCKWGRRKGCSS